MITQSPVKDALQQELNQTRWTNQRQQLLKKLWRISCEEAIEKDQTAISERDKPQRNKS